MSLPLSCSWFHSSPSRTPSGLQARYPGELLKRIATDVPGLLRDMAAQGDVSEIKIGPQRIVVLNHPDHIKSVLVTNQKNFVKGRGIDRIKRFLGEGLLTSEGEFHLRNRRMISPAFHRERIAVYGACMTEHAERTGRGLRDGGTVDVHDAMMHLTLGIAGETLFDVDVEKDAHMVGEALDLSIRMFRYTVLPLGLLMEYAPLRWVWRYHSAHRRLNELLNRLIGERRADVTNGTSGNSARADLLSMLVAAQDPEADGASAGQGSAGRGMSDQQVRDELVTLLMAGHETTAVALSWTWWLLSQNSDVEAKLHEELDRVLNGRTPVAQDMAQLTYTRMVFAESMRLYPPAWSLGRRNTSDFEVGGYTIRKGSLVLLNQMLVHRDPRWWPEPEKFDPERWTPEGIASRPKFSYFPFGAGTRICVGEQFAWMEGILILATIAQRWRFRHDPTHTVAMEPLITLRPKHGMRMTAHKRVRCG